MARGRMVNKKISNSQRVNDLPLGAQLLFTWLIPHLDCNGCFYGSAQMIKSLVVPRKSWPKSLIKKWLALMENSVDFESGQPLLQRYLVGKDEYLFMPGFVDEQIGLRRDKEKPDFPPFDGKNTESVGQTVPLSRTGSRTGSRREVEVKDTPLNPPTSSLFDPLIEKTLKDYEDTIVLPGTLLSAEMKAELLQACQTFSPASVSKAIKEAVKQNQRTWRYIRGILNNWHRDDKGEMGTETQ